MNKQTHFIEISKDAAHALLGNDYQKPINVGGNEIADWVEYIIHDSLLRVICNNASLVTQYYLRDINA